MTDTECQHEHTDPPRPKWFVTTNGERWRRCIRCGTILWVIGDD
jgi:hypothetical protein